MKNLLKSYRRQLPALLFAAAGLLGMSTRATAQCAVTSAPVYSNTCSADYYTAITATGTGLTSTITLTGSSCVGTYFNYFTSQGITAPAGTAVTLHVARNPGTYAAYLSVYIDWNNNGTYETTELAGTLASLPVGVLTSTYIFTLPTTSVVTGTNLHMRVMLSELSTGAPCTANYGETADFYCNVTCPPTTVTVSPVADSICAGSPGAALTASGAATYSWSPSAGLSATTGASVTATPSATTIYTVTGTTSIGCTGVRTVKVSVFPLPLDTVTVSGALIFCQGDSVKFTANSGNRYQWYNGTAAIAGATTAVYKATAPGSYTVMETSSHGCSSSSVASVVTVNPLPVPVITFNGKTLRTAGTYTSYQWYKNAAIVTGATRDTLLAHSNGNYTVKVTDANGCTGTSAVYVLAHLAVSNVAGSAAFSIYPNPAGSELHIVAPEKALTCIYSVDGRLVARSGDTTVDLRQLLPGLYVVVIYDENGQRMLLEKLTKN